MSNYDRVISEIATLPPDKLREVTARIALLSGKAQELSPSSSGDVALVYAELVLQINRRTGQKCPPLNAILKTRYGDPIKEGSALLIQYAKENLRPKGRGGMIQAIRLLVNLILRQVQKEGKVRLSVGPVSYQLKRIGEIVDQQFPGYLASGLLPIVLHH